MADIDLTPTEEMASNAARGLELREKHGRGGTAVGVARARDIKNRKNLSPDTVRRMHSFFSRHEGNQAGGEDDAGYISFLLWGGAAGKAWAKRKSAQLDKDENAMSDTRKEIMERLGSAGKVKAGRAEQVMRDGTVHLDFVEAAKWIPTLTEQELRGIVADARAAANAQPQGKKWNYYHDLTLTASDELQRRKRKSSRPGAKAKFAEDAREVAQEILRQLGGGRFMAMVGGKNAFHGTFGGKPGLQLDIGKGADGGINRVIVKLDRGSDTYDMEFWRIAKRGMDVKKVSEVSDVYADDLQRIFTSRTKFYTSLARSGTKATFGVRVGEAFEFEGKVYVVNSNADTISSLLSSAKSNSEKAMGLAAYMWKGWISYEGKRKSSRPGAKAKMGMTNAGSAFLKKMLREYASMKGTRWYDEAKYIYDNPTEHTDADVIAAVGNLKIAKSVSSRPGAKAKMAASWRKGNFEFKTRTLGEDQVQVLVNEGSGWTNAGVVSDETEARNLAEGYVSTRAKGFVYIGGVWKKATASRPGAKSRNAIREGEKVSASDDAVSRKIRKLMDEGKPQEQAVAIALDLERRGDL